MKTPLRFLKKTALAAIFASSAATVSMAGTQPCVEWFRENLSNQTADRWSAAVGDESTFGASSITVDGKVTYTPDRVSTEGNVAVTETTVQFTAPGATLPEVPSGAQAALTVAVANNVTNYYVLGLDNGQPAWIPVERSTVAPIDQAVPVKITIDYADAGTVTYAIGQDETIAYTGALANAPESGSRHVTALDFQGNGIVSGILSGTDGILATHKSGDTYYASYADALEAALATGNNTAVTAWDATASDGQGGTGAYAPAGSGTVANPYQIRDLDTLKAFQAAVANSNGLDYAYVQTADIALDPNEAWPGIGIQNGKDIVGNAAFDDAAFRGTYDGGNFTISNFQMVGRDGNPANDGKTSDKWEGLDYCGFFNSVSNAVIKNLKIAYREGKFAADTAKGTKESGATFVGVAKGSTLKNLTTLTTATNSVECSKGFGGIVGYLMGGSTVDSCTNNVNLTSLAPNKAGGIAMITQGGSGAAVITNCVNNGTTTGSNEHGGIVGYIGQDTVIADCAQNVADKFLHHQGSTVTVQGTVTGNATVSSYTGAATPGLNFATVDGSVATFVADNALAAGNQYKVMASGATATYEFTAPGTIAFDTALNTPTYAVTAAQGLDLSDATVGTVKTYTAASVYTVTFKKDASDAEAFATVSVVNGQTVAAPATDPTKADFTFRAWQLNGDDYDFTNPVTGNITLVADWIANKYPAVFLK